MLQLRDDEGEHQPNSEPKYDAQGQGTHLAGEDTDQDPGNHALDGRTEHDSHDSSTNGGGKPGGHSVECAQDRPENDSNHYFAHHSSFETVLSGSSITRFVRFL